jgi:hypothetical protein
MTTKPPFDYLQTYKESVISVSIEHFESCVNLLQGEPFDLHKFLELTSYIELLVLYDKFNVLGPNNETLKNLSPNTTTLLTGNLTIGVGLSWLPYEGKHQALGHAFLNQPSRISKSIYFTKYFFHALSDEHDAAIPYHVPLEALQTYLDAVQIEKSHHVYSLLFKAYAELSNSLRKEFEELQQYLKTNTVFVPPIMAMVLERASKPEDIVEIALELKDRFRPLREAFKEYEYKIGDPSLSLKNSLHAIKELKHSLEQLTSDQNTGNFIVSEWRDGLSLLPDSDSLESIDTGLTKVFLGKPLEWIVNRIKNRKIIGLFNLKKEFLNIQDYHRLIRKVFSHELKEQELKEAEQYWSAIDRLLHADSRLNLNK